MAHEELSVKLQEMKIATRAGILNEESSRLADK